MLGTTLLRQLGDNVNTVEQRINVVKTKVSSNTSPVSLVSLFYDNRLFSRIVNNLGLVDGKLSTIYIIIIIQATKCN